MMKKCILLFSVFILTPSMSMAITKCISADGETIFTDSECPRGSNAVSAINYKPVEASGLRPGEKRALGDVEAKEAERRDAKRYERERDARYHISHEDRAKIRKLEIEKNRLSDSLNRGSKSYGETSAIRTQIRGIDRQIEQLRAPKW